MHLPNTEGAKPPSFLDTDFEKWSAKFKQAVQDR